MGDDDDSERKPTRRADGWVKSVADDFNNRLAVMVVIVKEGKAEV
jgi:hypothetical protein